MIADRLRTAVLQAAISGRLTDQRPEDGTAKELLEQIAAERAALAKAKKLQKQKALQPVTEETQPFVLPPSWKWVRFQDVNQFRIGKTPKKAEPKYWSPSEIPWVAISDMTQGGSITSTKQGVTATAINECYGGQLSPAGTLIMSFKLTIGRCSFLGQDAVHNEAIVSIFPAVSAGGSFSTYLSHALPLLSQLGESKAAIKGNTLNSESIANLPIPLPPPMEQERIVAKLNELLPLLDELAELEREREYLDREFAKAIERAILQAAISGKLTKQHPEDGTAAELLETIKTERHQLEKEGKIKKQKPLSPVYKADEPFELPGTWAYPALGEIVTLIRGITFPASAKHKESFTGAVRCLTTGSVQSRYSDSADVFVDASFVKRSDQYLSRGDVILSTANSTALVGKSIYWDEAHERTFGGFLTVARAMDSRPAATRYLHTVLRTLFLGGAFAEKSTQTTNIANLSNKILYGVRIPLPPAAEQERIVAKLDRVQPLVRSIEELVS